MKSTDRAHIPLAFRVSRVWGRGGARDLRRLRDIRRLPTRLHLPHGRPLGVVRRWMGFGLEVRLLKRHIKHQLYTHEVHQVQVVLVCLFGPENDAYHVGMK